MQIKRRPQNPALYQALIDRGIVPLIAGIIAARPIPEHPRAIEGLLNPRLSDLSSPFLLKDLDKAVLRLQMTIRNKEQIAVETDHDCDGQTSHAVLITCLKAFGVPEQNLQSFIGHRLNEGYGLSDALTQRILRAEPRPSVLITADNGSSDEPRIKLLKEAKIDVIVTDHHAIPVEGIPVSAYAVLNPTRPDCTFNDPYIAGCMVAWLLMAALRRIMIDAGELSETVMSMTEVLDFVAVGTIADCVSLARSLNNRIVVHHGLKKLNALQRPAWQAVKPLTRGEQISAEDLGFTIGPLLNSDGRLADALSSVTFLLSANLAEASTWVQHLWQQNEARKKIQHSLVTQALKSAEQQVAEGRQSIVIALEEGHAGVHGIAASRIKDAFGRPTIIFSPRPNHPEYLTGSARGVDCLHLRDLLQRVHEAHPTLLQAFGGHKMAAGLSLMKTNFTVFSEAFESVIQATVQESLMPQLLTDGCLDKVDFEIIQAIQNLTPFGREFDRPLFEFSGILRDIRRFKDGKHLELRLQLQQGAPVIGLWFNAPEAIHRTLTIGRGIFAVASLDSHHYQGRTTIQLKLAYVRPL